MTPIHPSIEELRDEFQRNGLSEWLWPWLQRRLAEHAGHRINGRYRPQIYSPSGEWDQAACRDLANQFIIERGIQKGAIARALLVATDTRSVIAYLARSLEHFAISERPRSMNRNVFDRLRDVLDQRPDFIRLDGVPPHSYYGLADWEDDPPAVATDEQLAGASRYLPGTINLPAYSTGSRQSPGISSDDLEIIVRRLLTGLNSLLTAKQIMTVLNQRYLLRNELADGPGTPLDEAIVASVANPLEAAEAADLARRALAAFSPRQLSIVRLMLEDHEATSSRELAARLRISKSTAATDLQAIQEHFRLLGVTSDVMQHQILEALWPLLKAG